jgi:hypothetical protein
MQATIPPEFWAELKRQNLIEHNSPTPTLDRSAGKPAISQIGGQSRRSQLQ